MKIGLRYTDGQTDGQMRTL